MITRASLPRIAARLGLSASASVSDIVTAIGRERLRSEHDAQLDRLIDLGVQSKRILRTQRGHMRALAAKHPDIVVELVRDGAQVGFDTAEEEALYLVRREIAESAKKVEYSAALAQLAAEHLQVHDETRARMLFDAGTDVVDGRCQREVVRRDPAVAERARELVAASGTPIEYGEALRRVSARHPELFEEIRAERRGAVSQTADDAVARFQAKVAEKVAGGVEILEAQRAVATEDPQLFAATRATSPGQVEIGPATREFRHAVEDLMWADGITWQEAARRVHAAQPDLTARLARERGR